MKKIWSFLLCAVLLLGMAAPISAQAAEPAKATLSQGQAEPGKQIELQVELTGNPGLAAWTFELKWDPAVLTLEPESVEAGEAFANGSFLTNGKEPGKLLLTWYHTRNVKASGLLFTLTFAVRAEAADGVYPVTLRCLEDSTINEQEEAVLLQTTDGSVTVGTGKPEEPEKPEKPEKPENPEKPESPEQPDTPEKPEKPQEPGKPSEPQKPVELHFTDVPRELYCYDAVCWAVANQITQGAAPALFDPDGICTRAQMVTFLWRAAGCPQAAGTGNPFTDVQAEDYFAQAVQWAAENQITQGTTPTTFSPDQSVTRAQVVTLLWRQQGQQSGSTVPFGDVARDAYYTQAVSWAVSRSITAGTSATTFSPDAPCTRGQIVTFLYRSAE